MPTSSSTLRDPAELIATLAERVSLEPNTALVALVHQPATTQRLVAIEPLSTPGLIDDWRPASEEIFDVMGRLPIPDTPRPPSGSLILVTEHGWVDFMSDTAGLTPAMAA